MYDSSEYVGRLPLEKQSIYSIYIQRIYCFTVLSEQNWKANIILEPS